MGVKSCKGLKRCKNMKHQASLVGKALEDMCSRSGSLEADSEMWRRGYEICITDWYLWQEEGGQLAQRLNCHAHQIPPGGSLPEMGPNGQTFVSSSLRHGTWPAPAQVSPGEGPTAPDACLEEPRAICCLNPSGWAAVLP